MYPFSSIHRFTPKTQHYNHPLITTKSHEGFSLLSVIYEDMLYRHGSLFFYCFNDKANTGNCVQPKQTHITPVNHGQEMYQWRGVWSWAINQGILGRVVNVGDIGHLDASLCLYQGDGIRLCGWCTKNDDHRNHIRWLYCGTVPIVLP